MATLILSILLGTGFAYLALQNTGGVIVRVAGYQWTNVPLYLVALGVLLGGLFVAWFFNIVGLISTSFTLHGKDSRIAQSQKMIKQLEDQIEELKLENARLRSENEERAAEEHAYHEGEHQPSPLGKLRHKLAIH